MKYRGICHVHLVVRDLERSVQFYRDAFGMQLLHRRERMAFLRSPGSEDCLTLSEREEGAADSGGGMDHFGLILRDPAELEAAIEEIEAAGGRILERTVLEGGVRSAFVADPDGYRVQI